MIDDLRIDRFIESLIHWFNIDSMNSFVGADACSEQSMFD